MKSRVKWLDNMSFVGESASGHSVVMDGPPEAGGRNLGVRPMEMLLLGLGGCSSFDIISMLQKGKQDILDCEVEITAERADSEPKVFIKIHLHFIISGNALSEKRVARAIELSADKYCSASIMLGEIAEITHDYELKEITEK